MDKLRLHGPTRLEGRLRASGAKNAALPNLVAALLADAPVELGRVPAVRDIGTMARLLAHLGLEVVQENGGYRLTPGRREVCEAPYELVKTMRAGAVVLGPLVARRGVARVSLPGGCAIGVRPIDQHLKGLQALGAEVDIRHGYVEARATRLTGARFRFDLPTVGGTQNVLMAATLARGTTVLENCAREPEIASLARLLKAMGARIEGEGTGTIVVDGVESLGGARHETIPDRIEAGTYLIAAALTAGDVTVESAHPADLAPLLEKLDEIGAAVDVVPDPPAGDGGPASASIRVRREGALCPRGVVTEPHPGYPTDLQAQYMVLMTQADGVAAISETVFENRFQHVPELCRMGADVRVDGRVARVHGPTPLSGAAVMATDLRASACLVLAGLVADGVTTVDRIYHLDRGYEQMEAKLAALGARVERIA